MDHNNTIFFLIFTLIFVFLSNAKDLAVHINVYINPLKCNTYKLILFLTDMLWFEKESN